MYVLYQVPAVQSLKAQDLKMQDSFHLYNKSQMWLGLEHQPFAKNDSAKRPTTFLLSTPKFKKRSQHKNARWRRRLRKKSVRSRKCASDALTRIPDTKKTGRQQNMTKSFDRKLFTSSKTSGNLGECKIFYNPSLMGTTEHTWPRFKTMCIEKFPVLPV